MEVGMLLHIADLFAELAIENSCQNYVYLILPSNRLLKLIIFVIVQFL
jgi:hypothetical protein